MQIIDFFFHRFILLLEYFIGNLLFFKLFLCIEKILFNILIFFFYFLNIDILVLSFCFKSLVLLSQAMLPENYLLKFLNFLFIDNLFRYRGLSVVFELL